MPKTADTQYSAKSIQALEGLQAVRKRPGMYIGDVVKRGFHHLVYEVLDNCVDEALAGYCDTIKININRDESISIEDNGRGIPVDKHPVKKKPAVISSSFSAIPEFVKNSNFHKPRPSETRAFEGSSFREVELSKLRFPKARVFQNRASERLCKTRFFKTSSSLLANNSHKRGRGLS